MSEGAESAPAFPFCWEDRLSGDRLTCQGMRLLDWFAGQTLTGLLAAGRGSMDYDGLAETAYEQARAMIKAGNSI